MAITAERKMKLERLAIDSSQKAGSQIVWTDIVNHLIDNYAKDGAEDLITKSLHDIEREMALEMHEAEMVGGRGPVTAKIYQKKGK